MISARPPCKRAPPDDVLEAGSNPSSGRTVPRVRPLPASVLVWPALPTDAALDRTIGCYRAGAVARVKSRRSFRRSLCARWPDRSRPALQSPHGALALPMTAVTLDGSVAVAKSPVMTWRPVFCRASSASSGAISTPTTGTSSGMALRKAPAPQEGSTTRSEDERPRLACSSELSSVPSLSGAVVQGEQRWHQR